jgi:hypothetical protein
MKRTIIAIALVLAFVTCSSSEELSLYVVAYEDSKCAVLENSYGYTLVEIYTGYPDKGATVIGPVNRFGLEKFYDENGRQLFTGYIDDFGLSESRVIEKIQSKCRPRL